MIILLIALGIIAFFLFTIFQVYAAFLGFSFYFGAMFAAIAVGLSIIFRKPLTISIAAFFGAVKVWHWPWFVAALFVSPGLFLLIPGILVLLLTRMKLTPFFKGTLRSGNYSNVRNTQHSTEENHSKNTIIDAEYVDLTPQEKNENKN